MKEMSVQQKALPPVLAGLFERHFLIALAILLVASVGWNVAVRVLGFQLQKSPVEWPQGVEVNAQFRNVSFPKVLGNYTRLEKSESNPAGKANSGQPDGERIIPDNVLESLGMGTGLDRSLVEERKSNWYVSRIYGRNSGGEYKNWLLDVTYYTGGLDTVPHIGENCLVAAGAVVLNSRDIQMDLSRCPSPWNKIELRRVLFEKDGQRLLQYYVFSLNGFPESNWIMVRLKLAGSFTKKYVYFAKIQFAPANSAMDEVQADREAKEFIEDCLPAVLKALPTPSDLERLESGKK